MAYKVFTISGSPRGWRVQLACAVKGIPYETKLLSVSDGELKSPDFTALNSRQRVPVLLDDELPVSESIAILVYLEHKHPTPSLFGQDPHAMAEIWRIAMEGDHDLLAATTSLVRPVLAGKAEGSNPEIRAAAEKLHAEHARLEDLLGNSDYLAGASITLADIVCFPLVRFTMRGVERAPSVMHDLGFNPYALRYPRIAGWVDRIESVPGYDATFPPHWRASAA